MKTLSLQQTHTLISNIHVLSTGCDQLKETLADLPKDDPFRISAEAIIEGAEDFQHLEFQVQEITCEHAEKLFGELERLRVEAGKRNSDLQH